MYEEKKVREMLAQIEPTCVRIVRIRFKRSAPHPAIMKMFNGGTERGYVQFLDLWDGSRLWDRTDEGDNDKQEGWRSIRRDVMMMLSDYWKRNS